VRGHPNEARREILEPIDVRLVPELEEGIGVES
jgi:hypothetical protein